MRIRTFVGRTALVLAAGFALASAAVTAASASPVAAGRGGPAVAPSSSGPVVEQADGTTAVADPAEVHTLASGCWYSGGHWWCNNVVGAPVYAPGSATVVGYMYSNPSWFICRSDDGGYVGGPHPYRWEWTQADNGAWGWMKDIHISSETNPLPVC